MIQTKIEDFFIREATPGDTGLILSLPMDDWTVYRITADALEKLSREFEGGN